MTNEDTLSADMTRLGARPYSEVGVPMFIITQDLTATRAPQASTASSRELAERFAELAAALTLQNPDPGLADVARLVEAFADRHLLEIDGQRFTMISDDAG